MRPVLLSFLMCLATISSPGLANDPMKEMEDPGERLILVGTQLAEIVFALGAGERVAATHGYRDHIPSIEQTEAIRGFGPAVRSAETLLAFRPSAVWYMDSRIDEPTLAALAAIGTPLTRFPNAWTIEDIPAHIERIASALDRKAAGKALVADFLDQTAALAALPALDPQPSAIFILAGGNRPMLTAGRDSDFQRLMDLAGGRNASSHRGFQLLSAEEMMRIAPDIIFLLDEALPPGQPPVVAELPGLRFTPAARQGRYREIKGYCLSDFGINTPRCARRLRETLEHPDKHP